MNDDMSDDVTTVVLVDDDPLARQAVRTIVDSDPGLEVIGEADDGASGVRVAAELRPGLVVMDIRMPGTDGLGALRELRRAQPDLPVVMLTTFSDLDYIRRGLGLGADGFLLKTSGPAEIVAGLKAAVSGGTALSPAVAQRMVDRFVPDLLDPAQRHAAACWSALTERQRDVARVLSTGATNAEIGAALHLSETTVKGYVSEVIAALGVRNRVEVALAVLEAERGA